MSVATSKDPSAFSALFNLEVRSLNRQEITKKDLIEAVRHDVHQRLPISKVVFFKHFSGSSLLSEDDFREIICILTEGVALALSNAPDSARSYSHAAIVCQTELLSRR